MTVSTATNHATGPAQACPPPPLTLLANSIPKSGTHLLRQLLSGIPGFITLPHDAGFTHYNRQPTDDLQAIEKAAQQATKNRVIFGHVGHFPEVTTMLKRSSIAHFFIVRDLRDVVVSYTHWMLEIVVNHRLAAIYQEDARDFDEALEWAIAGIPTLHRPELSISHVPDIHDRVINFVPWAEAPNTLLLRFEDLVNPRRLGSECERILEAVNQFYPIPEFAATSRAMINAVDPSRSPTFRSGKTGMWQHAFNDRHRALFKKHAGDLLIRLGYESDNDW